MKMEKFVVGVKYPYYITESSEYNHLILKKGKYL